MLNTVKTTALAAAVGLSLTTGAQAVPLTVGSFGASDPGASANAILNSSNDTLTIDFTWSDEIDGFVDFTADAPFRVAFTSFTASGSGVSGFQVYSGFTGGNFTEDDEGDAQYIGFNPDCSYGPCVLVNGDGTSGAFAPVEEFAALGAGEYSFRFNEGGNGPGDGAAQFKISAIPLPAGAWLLLSALGGFAVLSRRRKTA